MHGDWIESCCQFCTVCCKCKTDLCNSQSIGFSSVENGDRNKYGGGGDRNKYGGGGGGGGRGGDEDDDEEDDDDYDDDDDDDDNDKSGWPWRQNSLAEI